jgi:hypothetical protein
MTHVSHKNSRLAETSRATETSPLELPKVEVSPSLVNAESRVPSEEPEDVPQGAAPFQPLASPAARDEKTGLFYAFDGRYNSQESLEPDGSWLIKRRIRSRVVDTEDFADNMAYRVVLVEHHAEENLASPLKNLDNHLGRSEEGKVMTK